MIKKIKREYIFLFIYVLLLMFFCAGSSPFIDNMQPDSSVFFCIGRSMTSGKIPYKDLFDHKGLYLYFINYIGALISRNNSIGIFVVEIIFMFFNSVLLYKISDVILNDTKKNIIFVGVMLLFILNFSTYQGGNLTESYCMTFQLISILFIIKYYRSNNLEHPPLYMLIHGVCVGIVLNLRANLIMMWGGIALGIIGKLVYDKKYKNAIVNIIFGMLGIIIALVPIVLYCIINDSLFDMINTAFVFNFKYISDGLSLIQKAEYTFFSSFTIWAIPLTLISVIYLHFYNMDNWKKITIALSYILSIICITISGRAYGHYFEYIIVYIIPVIFAIINKCSLLYKNNMILKTAISIICVLTIIGNMSLYIKLSGGKYKTNIYNNTVYNVCNYIKNNVNNYKKILVLNNETIYYNKLDVIPVYKYFYLPNVKDEIYEKLINLQTQNISQAKFDAIILNKNNNYIPSLESNYIKSYEFLDEEVWILNEKN